MQKFGAVVSEHITSIGAADLLGIPGLKELWAETLGDPRICIAILDGPVDQSHPSLAAAHLTQLETLVSGFARRGSSAQHGTYVTSVIFGQHDGPITGIAPRCRGLIVPIFNEEGLGSLAPCSQIDLARAILQAVQCGADIISISGGQLAPSGAAYPLLADAVRYCAANGVLIVAAAGNEGCECLHVPGALPSVLAVGAMNAQGVPLASSNWGSIYQTQGILALGENVLGADLGGGVLTSSGTSAATALVSGITALLLSIQLKHGQTPAPHAVRAAILHSALGCDDQPVPDCRRLLAGRLNAKGALSLITQGGGAMSDPITTQEDSPPQATRQADLRRPPVQMPAPGAQAAAWESSVVPATSDCNCGGGAACTCNRPSSTPVQLVYALGQLGYDFGTEARRDSIMQHMDERANPYDPNQLLAYLEKNPWDSGAILWTLNLDTTPIYVIQPHGPFAGEAYQRLRQFLREQLTEGVERVSIPGAITGRARLLSGQVVPVIWPELRCMYNWTTAALVEAICGMAPSESAKAQEREAYAGKREAVANFLERVYHELRNLGITPQERAINAAATNAISAANVFEAALKEEMELDTIELERSSICRPDSDCWDVKLTFFDPRRQLERARKVYRFTFDLSDPCPVKVGSVRSWSVR